MTLFTLVRPFNKAIYDIIARHTGSSKFASLPKRVLNAASGFTIVATSICFCEKLAAVNWDGIFAIINNDLDRVVDLFTNILLKAAADSIPNKVITVRKMDPPWINNAVRRAIRKRNRLNNRAKKTNLPEHWAKFRKFRNKTVNLVRQQKQV